MTTHSLPKGYLIEGAYIEDGDYLTYTRFYWLELKRWQAKRWFRRAGFRVVARMRVGVLRNQRAEKHVTRELTRFAVAREAARG